MVPWEQGRGTLLNCGWQWGGGHRKFPRRSKSWTETWETAARRIKSGWKNGKDNSAVPWYTTAVYIVCFLLELECWEFSSTSLLAGLYLKIPTPGSQNKETQRRPSARGAWKFWLSPNKRLLLEERPDEWPVVCHLFIGFFARQGWEC